MKIQYIFYLKMTFIVLLALTFTSNILAQAPFAFKYMALVRNADGAIISNQQIGVQIFIVQNNEGGSALFSEEFSISSNAYGQVNLEIGNGSSQVGSLESIDWSNGPYFIKIGIDINGGKNYTNLGASQILSLPYALYAKSAGNVFSGDYNDLNNIPSFDTWDKNISDDVVLNTPVEGDMLYFNGTNWIAIPIGTNNQILMVSGNQPSWQNNVTPSAKHYVGELFGGGIIFYIYNDGNNGLIASLDDVSAGAEWGDNGIDIITGNGASSTFNGAANTSAITSQYSSTVYAAHLCNNYSVDGFDDWYLPSMWELNLLYNCAFLISEKLFNDSDPKTYPISFALYWSSTEYASNLAFCHNFSYGTQSVANKNQPYNIRAIRKF